MHLFLKLDKLPHSHNYKKNCGSAWCQSLPSESHNCKQTIKSKAKKDYLYHFITRKKIFFVQAWEDYICLMARWPGYLTLRNTLNTIMIRNNCLCCCISVKYVSNCFISNFNIMFICSICWITEVSTWNIVRLQWLWL